MGLDGKPFSSAFNKLANAKNATEKPAAAPTPRPAGQAPAARPAGQAPAPSPRPAGLASAPSPRPAGLASAATPRPAGPAPTPKPAAPTPRPAAFAAKPASPTPAAAAPAPAPQLKSLDEIAKEVIRGNYGNGEERKRRLAAAGYNYEQVQKRVNEMLKK